MALAIRSFISPAAALVKVTTSSRSISTGRFLSRILSRILSTSTAVFPLPAAALTRMLQSLVSMTFCCSSVHETAIFIPPPQWILSSKLPSSFPRFPPAYRFPVSGRNIRESSRQNRRRSGKDSNHRRFPSDRQKDLPLHFHQGSPVRSPWPYSLHNSRSEERRVGKEYR